jgi:hypothetical protein
MGEDGEGEGGTGAWALSGGDRAVLSDSPEGRAIASGFIEVFGVFVSEQVRPVLRQVADDGGEPQLLVNGLAELLRSVAGTIEFAPGDRAGGPDGAGSLSDPDGPTG